MCKTLDITSHPMRVQSNRLNTTQKSKKASVSFAPPQVNSIKPCSSMSETEKNTIWYAQTELESFRDEVRSVSRSFREKVMTNGAGCAVPSRQDLQQVAAISGMRSEATENTNDNCSRGLELRISIERQMKKCIAIKAVLEAQRRLNIEKASLGVAFDARTETDHSYRLAQLSCKFTRWAREMALREATTDASVAFNLLSTSQQQSSCGPKVSTTVGASVQSSAKRLPTVPVRTDQVERSSKRQRLDNDYGVAATSSAEMVCSRRHSYSQQQVYCREEKPSPLMMQAS